MLAAAAVLKHGTSSYITDIREGFATALNGEVLKTCAFKTDYALQLKYINCKYIKSVDI